jgi:hypothetical protein
MQDIQRSVQRSIDTTLAATSDLINYPALRENRAFSEARERLRYIQDNFDRVLAESGRSGLLRDLRTAVQEVADAIDSLSPELARGQEAVRQAIRDLKRQVRSLGFSLQIPSRPLFGVLPVARLIPQDIHSLMDYSNAATCGLLAGVAEGPAACITSAALGATIGGVSLITDYRLSAVKALPIEIHQVGDYLWGAAAIAAPFVFGYYRKSPLAAAFHIGLGATTILASLVTDYRAARGVGRGFGKRGAGAYQGE